MKSLLKTFKNKRMQFTEDIEYCSIEDLKAKTIDSIIVNGQWLSYANRNQLNDKIEILRLSGFIRNGKVVIPKNKTGLIENPDINGCATLMFEYNTGFSISLLDLTTDLNEPNDEKYLINLF